MKLGIITSVVPYALYENYSSNNKYEIINSDLYPTRILKKNFLFYTTSKTDFNYISHQRLGNGIEYIFNLEGKNAFEIYNYEVPLNFLDLNIRCKNMIDKINIEIDNKDEKFKLKSSYEIIQEFISYCYDNKYNSVIFLNRYLFDGYE